MYIQEYSTELFLLDKTWKHPKCPSTIQHIGSLKLLFSSYLYAYLFYRKINFIIVTKNVTLCEVPVRNFCSKLFPAYYLMLFLKYREGSRHWPFPKWRN